MIFAATLDINRHAMGPVHRLANRVNLTVRIGIWDRNSVLVTLVALSQSQETMALQIGPRVLAHCTAIGKAALAFLEKAVLENYLSTAKLEKFTPNTITGMNELLKELEETRNRGYSIGHEELLVGRAGIGVPIFDKTAKLAGAISVHGNAGEILGGKIESLITEARATAAEISSRMGYYPLNMFGSKAG